MSKTAKAIEYTVWDEGTARNGSAEKILDEIRSAARENEEMQNMTVDQYADALIDDAEYFLPEKILDAFKGRDFPTKFDRALAYLCASPTSRVRLLSRRD